MAKHRASPNQADLFAGMPHVDPTVPASLSGSPFQTAKAVSEILKEDPRSREVIAAEMSVLLQQDVSKAMLDAYASPGREDHNISFDRMIGLIAATGDIDVLDRLLQQRLGVRIVGRNGLMLAEIGNIDRQIAQMKARRKKLETIAMPAGEGLHK